MIKKNFNIYTAESRVKNLKEVFISMISGLIGGRYLAYRLFIKEVKADYSRAHFGVLWDFLEPIVLAVIFMVLRQGGVIQAGAIEIPYAVFVVYGLLLWQTFSESITLPLEVLQRSKSLLTQVKIPSEALLLSVGFKILFNSLFRIVVLLGLSLAMGAFSWLGFVKFLLLYPTIILLGMAFGALLAPFNAIYTDVSKLVRISLRPLLYASPVIFVPTGIKLLSQFNAFNPVAIILANLRSLATRDMFINPIAFILTCMVMAAIFMIGWIVFHISIPILSDKV